MENFVKNEWGYSIYMSGLTSTKRGVMTLINNNFDQAVTKVVRDPNGNFLILEMSIQKQKIILVNIYGPNEDKPQFYKNLKQKIHEFECDNVVICGDWNLVIDPSIDTENYKNINNPNARSEVLHFIKDMDYMDAWRFLNEEKRGFTWKRLNPEKKQARLDYFLISSDMFFFLHECEIVPGYRTDHSGVLLRLQINFDNEKGHGYWKFNNSLLKDQDYVKKVHNIIKENIDRYSLNEHTVNTPSNNDTYDNNNFETNSDKIENDKKRKFAINDQLLLETILLVIRGETIKYSSYKKKVSEEKEVKLEKDIKHLEEKVQTNINEISNEEILLLQEKHEALREIRQKKIEGVMLRSRCRYEELGEKPTKYFLNLENRNYQEKVIQYLIDENGEEVYGTKDILEVQKNYYKNLYKEAIEIDDTPIEAIIGTNPKQLSQKEADDLEGELTYKELAEALKSMKNSKSPGNDGFTVEFFKFFWQDLGVYILRSINCAYENGLLSVTQKQGIITCLPKPNKPRHLLKNWRPISLLNVIYKIMSSAIANRLKKVLNNIIYQDQKGFISGRYIGENIRLIYDILFETKQQNMPGLLLSIDFKQAFDSISWKFIHKVLDYYNFGPSFKKWIKLFQTNVESCIIQNGFISEYFYLERGCRQGDPISPYIFILCVEILGLMIRNDENVKGIKINGKEYKLSQYADDTQLFLDGSELSLYSAVSILNKFYNMSGLNINLEKTRAVWIGSMGKSTKIMCKNFKLDWEQNPIKILGVVFTAEVFDIWDQNSDIILEKIKSMIKTWSRRKLTLIGRVTIIKSLMLSKFAYLFLALPNPPGSLVKSLEKMLFEFLWNKGPDRISRMQIVKNIEA